MDDQKGEIVGLRAWDLMTKAENAFNESSSGKSAANAGNAALTGGPGKWRCTHCGMIGSFPADPFPKEEAQAPAAERPAICRLCGEPISAHGYRHMLTGGKNPAREVCPPGAIERAAVLRGKSIPIAGEIQYVPPAPAHLPRCMDRGDGVWDCVVGCPATQAEACATDREERGGLLRPKSEAPAPMPAALQDQVDRYLRRVGEFLRRVEPMIPAGNQQDFRRAVVLLNAIPEIDVPDVEANGGLGTACFECGRFHNHSDGPHSPGCREAPAPAAVGRPTPEEKWCTVCMTDVPADHFHEGWSERAAAPDPTVGESGAKKQYSTPTLTGPSRLFRISESQRMALCSVIAEQMRTPDATEVHIDCSRYPAVETTLGDLLAIFTGKEA